MDTYDTISKDSKDENCKDLDLLYIDFIYSGKISSDNDKEEEQNALFSKATWSNWQDYRASLLAENFWLRRGIAMSMEGDHLKPSIGFIGMGHMGGHMAQRLLDAGYHLTVYDRTKEKGQEVGQRGVQVAQTPRDLAAGCQIVMASVSDDRAQAEVMFGPNGALAGVHGRSILIDLSTVSPEACSGTQEKRPCGKRSNWASIFSTQRKPMALVWLAYDTVWQPRSTD
jgi:hypothetical protein